MNKAIFSLVLFIVCVFTISADQADDYFQQGKTAYQKKEYDNAFEFFQQAVRLSPETAKYQYNLGLAARKLNKYKIAADAFMEARRLDPSISFTNDKEAFESKLEEMVRLSDSSTANKSTLTNKAFDLFTEGEAAYKADNYAKAFELFGEAVKAEPGIAKYQYNLGLAARKLGKYTIARDAFLKAKELDPAITFTDNKEAFLKKLEEVTGLAGTEKTETTNRDSGTDRTTYQQEKKKSSGGGFLSYGIMAGVSSLIVYLLMRKKKTPVTGAGQNVQTNTDQYNNYHSHSTTPGIGKKNITKPYIKDNSTHTYRDHS